MSNLPKRCHWCGSDPLYIHYHDTEWGKPSHDDRYLFAMLCLEGMQAGLSWITVLRKRAHYYQVFENFDPIKIAQFDHKKVDELMTDAGIIRHRGKIEAIINNATCYLKITENQPFNAYLWDMVDNQVQDHRPTDFADMPTRTQVSDNMAKQLKKDGFKFIGTTTCYAFMQAVGMVNDHVKTCEFG